MQKVGPYWYPDSEERLHRGHARVEDIEQFIVPEMGEMRTVVQAGGAAGVWPNEFAAWFDMVYTAEPNAALRECMDKNICRSNVTVLEGAFWDMPGVGKLVEHQPENMGAWYIEQCLDGNIPLMTIDSLDLGEVDLIQLDVEGGEFEALEGARETIARCRPVIILEVKATQAFYGRTPDDLRIAVERLGYERKNRFGRDELWVPTD
jgi:FkbM family methyltransferase